MSKSAIRALAAALVMGAGLFVINKPAVFAQAGPSSDAAGGEFSPAQADDRAAERSLWLNGAGDSAAAPTNSRADGRAEPASTGSVVRVLLTLLLAAAAIYGVVYIIKRASRKAGMRDPYLKVLASAPLGANRAAHIVAVGSRAWLVGAAENGVSLIGEIDDKDLLNAMFMEDSQRSANALPGGGPLGRILDFKAMLRRLGMPVQSGAPDAENIRKRRERLKGLQ